MVGKWVVDILLECFLVTTHNSSCGKVTFSQASVSHSVHRVPCPFSGWVCPGVGMSRGWVCLRYAPQDTVCKGVVRIILQCILVMCLFRVWEWACCIDPVIVNQDSRHALRLRVRRKCIRETVLGRKCCFHVLTGASRFNTKRGSSLNIPGSCQGTKAFWSLTRGLGSHPLKAGVILKIETRKFPLNNKLPCT